MVLSLNVEMHTDPCRLYKKSYNAEAKWLEVVNKLLLTFSLLAFLKKKCFFFLLEE